MASLDNFGNEFAAPSTASFGGSNEENLEDTVIQKQVLVPASVASSDRLSGYKSAHEGQLESHASPAANMTDMFGNAAASSGDTPLPTKWC